MFFASLQTSFKATLLKGGLCISLSLLLFSLSSVTLLAQETVSPSGTLVTPEGVDTGNKAYTGASGDGNTAATGPGSVVVLPGGTYSPQQHFTPLVGIPGLTNVQGVPSDQILTNLIQTLYRLAIVAGALIAVLKITMAGLQYMGTDSIGSKEGAKNDIQSALLGLVIILSAVLIMETISGQVNLNVLNGAPQVNGQGSPISLTSGSVNPASPEVQSTLGCGQTGGGTGRQCANNTVPIIQGGTVSCAPAGTVTSALTQEECQAITQNSQNPIANPQAIIRNGGAVHNIEPILRTELDDTKRDELLQRCIQTSGNPNATVTFPPYYPPGSRIAHATMVNVMCSSMPR